MQTFWYRDKKIADQIIAKLKISDFPMKIMHVCGTQQDTIVRFGLDKIFRDCKIDMRQGPGCPVCIIPAGEFEEAIALAKKDRIIAAYGDALKIPTPSGSLFDTRTEGHDIRIVYSIHDALNLADQNKKDVIFLALGFETTAPSTAVTILNEPPKNFHILNCHRYVPPALYAILDLGEIALNGLIEPGHVSTVIGCKPYEDISTKYHIPQVIAGFEPLDILFAVYMIALQNFKRESKVENEYTRAVRYEGNVKALEAMNIVFEPFDSFWRGFGIIRSSGMKLKPRFERCDARKTFADELKNISHEDYVPEGCKCDEVIRGLIYPNQCPLFGKACTPEHPVGACMVSIEGSCNIEFKYQTVRNIS